MKLKDICYTYKSWKREIGHAKLGITWEESQESGLHQAGGKLGEDEDQWAGALIKGQGDKHKQEV